MEEISRFTWQSVIILLLTAAICFVGLWLYEPSSWAGDAVRGFLASVLAAVASLLLFYHVDPRMRRPDYLEVMARSGFRRIVRNMELEPAFWVDLISDMASTESEVFLVGKRLSEWRQTSTYSHPLQGALAARASRAKECSNPTKYRTTIVLEDNDAYLRWLQFLSSMASADSRIMVLKTPYSSIPYGLTICGKKMAVVHYVGDRTTGDNPTIDVLHDSPVWKLYSDDIRNIVREIGTK